MLLPEMLDRKVAVNYLLVCLTDEELCSRRRYAPTSAAVDDEVSDWRYVVVINQVQAA